MKLTEKSIFSQLLLKNKWIYLGALLSTLATVLIGFITPLILAETADVLLGSAPSSLPVFIQKAIAAFTSVDYLRQNLWVVGVVLVVLNVINGLFSYAKGRLSAVASEDIAKGMRNELYEHIQHLPFSYHVNSQTGDLIQRCTSDVETLRRFLAVQLVEVTNTLAMIVIALVLLFGRNVQITLYSLMLIPPLFAFAFLFYKRVIRQFRQSDESEGAMSTVLQENLAGMRVVRAFGMQQKEVEKFDGASRDLRKKDFRLLESLALYWSIGDILSLCQSAVTLIICIIFAIQGKITIGTLFVFTSYIGMLLFPIRQLGRILSDAGKAKVSIERLNEILHAPREPEEPHALFPPIDQDIVFENVSFWYKEGNKVLDNLSFTIPAGKTVALLGPTGSGKSTLVALLQRLYAPKEGRITIGGVDISQIDRTHLRNRMGLILQEPFLYSKTIGQNIGIAFKDPDQKAIVKAATIASAHDFILESVKGYDTIVGERGVTLSGGQKQRIAIARTLLKKSDVLIFDDSLSAVDTQTDMAIRKALKDTTNQLTTIIISHRLTTLSAADTIFVLEKGHISAQGNHEALLETSDLYRQIYGIQTSLEEEMTLSQEKSARQPVSGTQTMAANQPIPSNQTPLGTQSITTGGDA